VLLRRLYLIYGIGGSGKSTFASLLREAAGDTSWSSGLEIDVNDAGQLRRVNQASDPVWQARRVFSRDYVNEKTHLSRWNEARVIHVEELTPGRVEEFLVARRKAGYTLAAVPGLTPRCRTTASPSVQRREWPGTTPSCIERPLRLSRPTRSSGLPHCAGRPGCVPRAPMPSSNPSPRRALRSTRPARRRRAAGKPPALSRHK